MSHLAWLLIVAVGLGVMALTAYLMRHAPLWEIVAAAAGSGVLYAVIVGAVILGLVILAMRNMH